MECHINESSLNTGDILLFRGGSDDDFIDKLIEGVTHSVYEHAAIIIRDPWWIDEPSSSFSCATTLCAAD